MHLIYEPEAIANTDLHEDISCVEQLSIVDTGHVITSGMLCHEEAFSKIGPFKANVLIDAVDEYF